jgi:hypothetical protein
VRESAPEDLRYAVLDEALKVDFGPHALRAVICRVLRKRPDPSNWSEYPNVWDEVQDLVYECEWFRVYDIIEAIADELEAPSRGRYRDAMNEFFVERGIGWQVDGVKVVSRGTDAFESSVHLAAAAFAAADRVTAQREIEEALRDLSRRPVPDLRRV